MRILSIFLVMVFAISLAGSALAESNQPAQLTAQMATPAPFETPAPAPTATPAVKKHHKKHHHHKPAPTEAPAPETK